MATVHESDVDQYLETALWSSTGEDEAPLDRDYSVDDFAPEARAQAKADLEAFWGEAGRVFDALGEEVMATIDLERWPHDFWLTRNRHGVGFWDREEEYGEAALPLTALAKRAGEVNAYVGDDGQVYFGG